MAGWITHTGAAVHLPQDNVDTDQLIPARFMSVPRAQGYGRYLLHDMRRDAAGQVNSAFPLNAAPDASILIAGRNFGSGSSREAAVYALVDAGFRAVIAPSFGDIFAGNAVNNGLLPARLAEAEIDTLAAQDGPVEIDLATSTLRRGRVRQRFDLDDMWRTKLMKGWDDIDLTLQQAETIAAYRAARAETGWTLLQHSAVAD